jgi:hypothetical protein
LRKTLSWLRIRIGFSWWSESREFANMKLVLLAVATAVAILASAGSAAARGINCGVATPAKVKAALGVTVSSPYRSNAGPVTVCEYKISAKNDLEVRVQTHASAAVFARSRTSLNKLGGTKTVRGLGSPAYSASFGGANTLVVFKHGVLLELIVKEPLGKIEALAKLVLPSL